MPGYAVTRIFNQAALAQGVQSVLVEDYGLDASGVSCPAGIVVVTDVVFTCTADVGGRATGVPVRITSRSGGYEVGRP